MRLFHGLKSPLADRKPGDIDYFIVRENNEGEYSSIGGRMYEGTELEGAIQTAVFTKKGCERVMRYAFNLAMTRKRREVVSATKSNGISISMPYWDERFAAIAKEYPQVKTSQFHVDILAAHLVRNPHWFDVIVGSNLFGDILSDLGPATTGTIAIAPGGNINPERSFPSMFEPVHGSAPDIAGKGIANPIGQIWSGAMMLEHLGHKDAAAAIVTAIETLFADTDVRTADMGGKATCKELGETIVAAGRPQLRPLPVAGKPDPPRIRWNCRRSFGMIGRIIGGPGMARRPLPHLRSIAVTLAICAGVAPVYAQQWQTETERAPPARIGADANSGHAAHRARHRAAAQYHGRAAYGARAQARSRWP